MKLYEKNINKLVVYDFSAKPYVLTGYRKHEMETIPDYERVLKARKCKSLDGFYDKLRYGTISKQYIESILNNYYNGTYSSKKATSDISYEGEEKYYLQTKPTYLTRKTKTGEITEMSGIIQIPESLYILQLLEQGNIQALEDYDISEQLSLYALSQTGESDQSIIDSLSSSRLLNKEKLDVELRQSSHILKRIRKENGGSLPIK